MIVIIDYGMGNLRSVEKAFEKVGFDAVVTDKSDIIENAEKIVLPGVGAFKDAIDGLRERDLIEPIKNHIKKNKLFLGICLGLHLLFTRSYEDGVHEGLGIVPGEVVRFDADRLNMDNTGGQRKATEALDMLSTVNCQKLKIPHMGWNTIREKKEVSVLKGLPVDPYMYFVHSYFVVPDRDEVVAAETEYGIPFVSMISIDNIFAMQFHPEKSQQYGLMILKNFGEL
ncbi:MAG: imidazole glycerol phosphate synthase subunit HisH [Candidatus Scalindua rubra]|uniref:Imidazole glycerol phosphate synthase subunit HisH n=1 Tax=Candidatus Scalindua brodae TaxID=237368 RepID=A0A0B0EAT9_9BACT|nr:MAG: imidazole glycerol phosphate synthase subunit [Candidatus Scalindua brodae]MBZ0107676.1 imidazole glycerol phosphate synthase subunit HisH [Candidatus Scalindua rubra]TWU35567.1 Imidazole glycerol phosphate synthase subunit HisH 1 [Candidatus Brocadiaceae bacterium S225]